MGAVAMYYTSILFPPSLIKCIPKSCVERRVSHGESFAIATQNTS